MLFAIDLDTLPLAGVNDLLGSICVEIWFQNPFSRYLGRRHTLCVLNFQRLTEPLQRNFAEIDKKLP